MLKYALFDYIPKRKMRRATFEQQDTTRKVLDFKAGLVPSVTTTCLIRLSSASLQVASAPTTADISSL